MSYTEQKERNRLWLEKQLAEAERMGKRAEKQIPTLEQTIKTHRADKEAKEKDPQGWADHLQHLSWSLDKARERIAEAERIRKQLEDLDKPRELPPLMRAWNQASESERSALLSRVGVSIRTGETLAEID